MRRHMDQKLWGILEERKPPEMDGKREPQNKILQKCGNILPKTLGGSKLEGILRSSQNNFGKLVTLSS